VVNNRDQDTIFQKEKKNAYMQAMYGYTLFPFRGGDRDIVHPLCGREVPTSTKPFCLAFRRTHLGHRNIRFLL
jgi:hypothetical protein